MNDILDINITEPNYDFKLMNDICISQKDLKNLVAITLLQEQIDHNDCKKTIKKILKGVHKYE